MYISGSEFDFELRLHQLPINSNDLVTGFLLEGENYTGSASYDLPVRWDREYIKKELQFGYTVNTGNFIPFETNYIPIAPTLSVTNVLLGVITATNNDAITPMAYIFYTNSISHTTTGSFTSIVQSGNSNFYIDSGHDYAYQASIIIDNIQSPKSNIVLTSD